MPFLAHCYLLDRSKKLPALFYENAQGREPVREWILSLSEEDRKRIGFDIQKVEFGWPLGMPYCRSLGSGLWETRTDLADGRTARVLFCIAGARMVLLHAFVKKTQRTPEKELRTAMSRMKEVI